MAGKAAEARKGRPKRKPRREPEPKPKRKPSSTGLAGAAAALRKAALALPGAHEDFPWGHSAYKVGRKIFLVTSLEDGILKASVKLPLSGAFALMQPWAQPTGYGLGRSGWVSASFKRSADVPMDLLRQWIVESWRAIAPKKLSATLRA